ncbi:hypothetical protein [Nocardia seriolae]|uniref:hypothetical protein n=1 Tax=Nocardia seriolae TaxID=37332 RepID=UPI00210A6195|nr:hypothetical protein [Nocardia seriolae]
MDGTVWTTEGRHPARPAGRRDHRGHRAESLHPLRRTRKALRLTRLRPRRRHRHRGTEGPPRGVDAGHDHRHRNRRRTRHRHPDPGPRQWRGLGGVKVTTENAWFAARPSGTEDKYKIYAESFQGPEHLAQVQAAAEEIVGQALSGTRVE